jgi:hypothetical protein
MSSPTLPGYAQMNQSGANGTPEFPRNAPAPGQQSSGRPSWLPAYAYSNDAMVCAYHNLDIFFWDKRSIPNKPQRARLSTSVSRYWHGNVDDPCMVLITPLAVAPGNFTFQSQDPNGPRGWLQAQGTTNWQGFPMYRYWLDQRF